MNANQYNVILIDLEQNYPYMVRHTPGSRDLGNQRQGELKQFWWLVVAQDLTNPPYARSHPSVVNLRE